MRAGFWTEIDDAQPIDEVRWSRGYLTMPKADQAVTLSASASDPELL